MKGLTDAEALLQKFEQEPEHVRHVARLSGQLFSSLQEWHQRDASAGELLHLGALLHDIGWSQTVDGAGHHKHSARLILERSWKEREMRDVRLIAVTARYHRKSLPSEKHALYHSLDGADRKLVCELAGILRVADALDRTHTQRIELIEARVTPDVIELSPRSRGRGDWMEERRAVLKKADLLEIASGRKIRFAE